jgi:leucyl aminopeptidase
MTIQTRLSPAEPSQILNLAVDLLSIATGFDASDGKLGLDPLLTALDTALGGQLRAILTEERFRGKPGQTATITTLGKIGARRVILLGVGSDPESDQASARALRCAGTAGRLAVRCSAKTMALAFPGITNASDLLQPLAEGVLLGTYAFDRYFDKDDRVPVLLSDVQFCVKADTVSATESFKRAQNTAAAVINARDMVNEPAEVMTPTRMAEIATEIAQRGSMQIQVLDRDACEKEGMGLYLAVGRGSVQPPKFIHMTYKHATPKKRIVLVGKGVTFDSGGHSLKPSDGMLDMKTDMAGAAAVISSMQAIAAEQLQLEVHAIAACCENMLSGSAYRLGDIFRSRAGKTVEINNTDAEGRLTLADALSFGVDLKPDQIFDFATLTGAIVVALGNQTAGVMTNTEALRESFLAAASATGEPMWPMPLPPRLKEQLKSEVADMKNTGERWGGALTAGLFLKEFVGDTPWVHVDLAGPSRADKDYGHVSRGGSGYAVATILNYLRGISA